MTVVLDANVLLAAFGTGGTCREVVETCLLAHHICLSEFILDDANGQTRQGIVRVGGASGYGEHVAVVWDPEPDDGGSAPPRGIYP